MAENRSKHAFQVIDGGKSQVDDNEGGPEFGSGKAEAARDPRKPLITEEIDEMHRAETPVPPERRPPNRD